MTDTGVALGESCAYGGGTHEPLHFLLPAGGIGDIVYASLSQSPVYKNVAACDS